MPPSLTGIAFSALWPLYVIFFLARDPVSRDALPDIPSRAWPTLAAGSMLVLGSASRSHGRR